MSGTRKVVIEELKKILAWAIEQQGTGFSSLRNVVHKNLENATDMALEYWQAEENINEEIVD